MKITDISHDTIAAMIHFFYTGELGDRDLDVQEVAYTAEKYNLPGWVEKVCIKLSSEEVTEELVADLVIAGSRYAGARKMMEIAVAKIKARREIAGKKFREKLWDYQDCLFDLTDFLFDLIE